MEIENELAKLESAVADPNFWPLLSNDFIDLGHLPYRKIISLFLATLFVRNPAILSKQIDLHNKIVGFVEFQPKELDGQPPLRDIYIGRQGHQFDYEEWEQYKRMAEDDIHGVFVNSIKPNAFWIAEKLLAKRWSVVFVDQPLFVTSTSPFFVTNPELDPIQVLGPKSTLMWPISPTRILCLDELDEPSDLYYPLRDLKAVGMYTYLSWVNTDHFLLPPRPIPDVLHEMIVVCETEKKRQKNEG